MKKLKKIVTTIFIFITVMLFICFVLSISKVFLGQIDPNQIIEKTGLYFLYTIGYGALDGDTVVQNVLAVIGIISTALMTTYLTINLFWRLDDVKLDTHIKYDKDKIRFSFYNNGNPICDVKVNFTLFNNKTSESFGVSNEYNMPVLLKKSAWQLEISLNETFWYNAIKKMLLNNDIYLYCIYSFVDTKSGQSSIKLASFNRSNINVTLGEFNKPVYISNNNLKVANNVGKVEIMHEENSSILSYTFNKSEDGFVMAYYDFHQHNLNLEKYQGEAVLEVNIEAFKKCNLALEIKGVTGLLKRAFYKIDGKENIVLKLNEVNLKLSNITEICFTIFTESNPCKNQIHIEDLIIKSDL